MHTEICDHFTFECRMRATIDHIKRLNHVGKFIYFYLHDYILYNTANQQKTVNLLLAYTKTCYVKCKIQIML